MLILYSFWEWLIWFLFSDCKMASTFQPLLCFLIWITTDPALFRPVWPVEFSSFCCLLNFSHWRRIFCCLLNRCTRSNFYRTSTRRGPLTEQTHPKYPLQNKYRQSTPYWTNAPEVPLTEEIYPKHPLRNKRTQSTLTEQTHPKYLLQRNHTQSNPYGTNTLKVPLQKKNLSNVTLQNKCTKSTPYRTNTRNVTLRNKRTRSSLTEQMHPTYPGWTNAPTVTLTEQTQTKYS